MTMPSDTAIKSGTEIVSEFLDALTDEKSLDLQTVTCIKNLHKSGQLSRTRLLQALEEARSSAQITKQSE
jgi:hypothetical protein